MTENSGESSHRDRRQSRLLLSPAPSETHSADDWAQGQTAAKPAQSPLSAVKPRSLGFGNVCILSS